MDRTWDAMTAGPLHSGQDPDDPAAILQLLPEQYHAQFYAEYAVAVEQARRPKRYHLLHELLRRWHLRALAYSDPGYPTRLAEARQGGTAADVPAEQLIPSWPRR